MTVAFTFDGSSPVVPRDAATVLVLREGRDGPEVFFVRRNTNAGFMGGAYVFPGGRLDPEDSNPDVPCDLCADEAARRLGEPDAPRARGLHVAALRECLEESGILLATEAVTDDTIASLRRSLEGPSPVPIGRALRAVGVTLAASALTPFVRWITPKLETRRFDARFFLARAPSHTQRAIHDGQETIASAWLSPHEAIQRARRREIVLAPPTWRTLDMIRDARSVSEVFDRASSSIPVVEPEVVVEDEAIYVVMPASGKLETRFRYDDGYWVPSTPG